MKEFHIPEFDIIFLSYQEPRMEEFWADLITKVPWAKRVHGVKGFDSAHKACAELSSTDRFITIDGDCTVAWDFITKSIKVDDKDLDAVFSWSGKNYVNGLVYGNGGAKCWVKDFVLNMKSHENAEDNGSKVDFCWDTKYLHLNESYTTTFPNSTPYQGFRSGFREGVKMSLDEGFKVSPYMFKNKLWVGNLKRLNIWCSVGADVDNGLWMMYGARLGAYMTNLTDWDIDLIADYDWFEEFWNDKILPSFEYGSEKCKLSNITWNKDRLWEETIKVGNVLRQSLGMEIVDLTEEGSIFFKDTYLVPERNRLYPTEYV